MSKEKDKGDGKLAGSEGAASAVSTVSGAAAVTRDAEADANSSHLQSLMDMGFSREHCLEALHHTGGLEQATEYLLSNPSPLIRVQQVTNTLVLKGLY